jgi:ATP-dependent protease ClpP protease subunit
MRLGGIHDDMNSSVNKSFGFMGMKDEIIYKGFKRRILYIYDDIDEEMELILNHSLEKLCKPNGKGVKEPITIKISSYGGDSNAMFSIISSIESCISDGYPIITKGYGKVASASIPILLSGSERYCQKLTRFTLHNIQLFIMGGVSGEQIKRIHSDTDDVLKAYEKVIISKSKISKEEFRRQLDRDAEWSFFGTDALKLGMVDKLI